MQILLLIFLFLLFGILIIFSVFGKLISFFFGRLSGKGFSEQRRQGESYSPNNNDVTDKVFSKDEGEYVKFEEVE